MDLWSVGCNSIHLGRHHLESPLSDPTESVPVEKPSEETIFWNISSITDGVFAMGKEKGDVCFKQRHGENRIKEA